MSPHWKVSLLAASGFAAAIPPFLKILEYLDVYQWTKAFAWVREMTAIVDPQYLLLAVFLVGVGGLIAVWIAGRRHPMAAASLFLGVLWFTVSCWSASRAIHPPFDRRLDPDLREALTIKLTMECTPQKSCAPPKVRVVWYGTREAEGFARDFVEVFTKSGWDVVQQRQNNPMIKGTWFAYTRNTSDSATAEKFLRELQASFQPVYAASSDAPTQEHEWSIWIGPRDAYKDEPHNGNSER